MSWVLRTILSDPCELLHKFFDDYNIYKIFLKTDIDLGERIHSPLRHTDDNPSFCLYIPTRINTKRTNEIWYKDLGDGEYGNIYSFVKKYLFFNKGITLNSNKEVAKYILNNFKNIELSEFEYKNKVTDHIYYRSKPFSSVDINYWSQLDINPEDLKFWNVKSMKYLLTQAGEIIKEFQKNELAFIYLFKDKEKLYQPYARKEYKFRNTCPGDDYTYYQGFDKLRGKHNGVKILIITKSFKDVMVFYKYFNEYLYIPVDVIAPHAESINLNPEFVDLIKQHYDLICCVSDFDRAGVKFAQQCKKLGFKYKFIDTKREIINNKAVVLNKDISDFRKNTSKETTKKLLKSWNFQKLYL